MSSMFLRARRLLIAGLVVAALGGCGGGERAREGPLSQREASRAFQRILDDARGDTRVGVSAAVVDRGRLRWSGGSGVGDRREARSAGQAALFFSNHARSVTILCRGTGLAKSMSQYLIAQLEARANITTLVDSEVTAAYGDVSLEEIDVHDRITGANATALRRPLHLYRGRRSDRPAAGRDRARRAGLCAHRLGHARNRRLEPRPRPYLLETSVPGIFACGDVRFGPVKRVAAAVGEGSMSIAFVHQYLKEAEVAHASQA